MVGNRLKLRVRPGWTPFETPKPVVSPDVFSISDKIETCPMDKDFRPCQFCPPPSLLRPHRGGGSNGAGGAVDRGGGSGGGGGDGGGPGEQQSPFRHGGDGLRRTRPPPPPTLSDADRSGRRGGHVGRALTGQPARRHPPARQSTSLLPEPRFSSAPLQARQPLEPSRLLRLLSPPQSARMLPPHLTRRRRRRRHHRPSNRN